MRAAAKLDATTDARGPATGQESATRLGISIDELSRLGRNGYNQAIRFRRAQDTGDIRPEVLAGLDMWMYGFELGRLFEREPDVE